MINLCARSQDGGHGFGVDSGNFSVGFGRQKPKNIIGRLPFPHLAHGTPPRPDAGKARQWPCLVQGEPDRGFGTIRQMFVSEKLVNGTTQRCSGPSQRRQCGDAVLRIFVTPASELRPFRANTGDGIPQRAIINSRPLGWLRTIGAA
jgi:hypothetical protein